MRTQSKGLSGYQRTASRLLTSPSSTGGRETGRRQPELEGEGQSWPQRQHLHQTVSRPQVANQVYLGFWMVDIHQEGHCQRSAPQKRHMAHLRWCSCCTPRKPSSWDHEGDKMHRSTWGECAHQAPVYLSCLDLGRAKNAGPTESVPLWSTQEPEPEQLRPGKCTQPKVCFRQIP